MKEARFCDEPMTATVFMSAIAAAERSAKRAWIALILAISMLVATNAAWVYYESQFDSVTYETVYEVEDGE